VGAPSICLCICLEGVPPFDHQGLIQVCCNLATASLVCGRSRVCNCFLLPGHHNDRLSVCMGTSAGPKPWQQHQVVRLGGRQGALVQVIRAAVCLGQVG
jgi:hypothetical protein